MTTEDNGSRRTALYAKREALRAHQARHMARQRREQDAARFQRFVGGMLDAAGVRYQLLWPEDKRWRGPLPSYPIGFASIRWDHVPDAEERAAATDGEMKRRFDEAIAALGVPPHATVIADWCLDGLPRVVLCAGDASVHAITLMRGSSDLWVYSPDADWVIEIYHEGRLTWAARPGLPEHAGAGWRPRAKRGSPGRSGGGEDR